MIAKLRRWWWSTQYRPTRDDLLELRPGDGELVSVTPWRDLLVVTTQYRVYAIGHGQHTLPWDINVQMVGRR